MKKLFFMAATLLLSCQLFAQVPNRQARPAPAATPPPIAVRDIHGIVKDATGQTIIGANIVLSSKLDTLRAATNADGIFIFHDVKSNQFTLSISSVGYLPLVQRSAVSDIKKTVTLDPITLKDESKELGTVTINGTPSITYKTDTVEYKASDYKVRENSTVDELLKHMEGFEVGSDGSVTHQGQAVTKARLNGKDYAGGNLAQAIQSLPADIVEKIQVVDDYGDQAARTGVKDGDPTKVLNITTLANKSIGNIGRATVMEGTHDIYNDVLFYNRINANQVITLNGSLNSQLIGVAGGAGSGQGGVNSNGGQAGTTERGNISTSYRDQVSKTTQINGSYSYGQTHNFQVSNSNGASFNTITLINPITKARRDSSVTTIDTLSGVTRNNSFSHNFTFDYEWQPDSQNYVRVRPTYSYNNTTSNTGSSANYVGYQYETTSNHTTNLSTAPTYGVVATYQFLWKHDHRQNISVSYTYNNNGSNSVSTQNNHILYRDATGVPVKDSLVNRSTMNNQTIKTNNVVLQYVQPLSRIGAPVTQMLEFNESYNDRSYDVTKIQSNVNSAGVLARVDSLSNIYKYSFAQGNFALQYRRNGAKSQLTLGVRAITANLSGDNISKNTTTNKNDFYVIPVFRYQYQWTRTEQISVNYNGNAQEPSFAQIQPVPDYSNNPQNPIFGNPDLKPAFNHTITSAFNDYIANSKFNFSLRSVTTFVQDKIESNNILISQPIIVGTKTTNNIITQTHYLNTNGAMSETITHNVAKQLNDRAYNLELNGTISYNYDPIYNNNIRYHQTEWIVNERFGPRINPNTTLEINPYISYQDQRDFSTIPSTNPLAKNSSEIKTTQLDLQGRIFLGKERRFTFEYELKKNYITGIQGFNTNPFVVDAYVDYEFFARKNGILRLSAFDIFNQNVFINHNITATGYTNTQSNTISRYFTLSFILNLSKFSGTPMKNGIQQRRRGDGSFIVD
jgi:hypothetical protein